MCLPVVLPQQIPAEVTVEIPPYGVDVVCCAVLDVVILDKESCGLNTIVMGLARFEAAGPTKMNLTDAVLANDIHALLCDFRRHGRCIFIDQHDQQIHLGLI